MKRYLMIAAIGAICVGLFCSLPAFNQAQAQGKKAAPAAEKITVLNPLGTAPPITVKAMAEPLSTLDGKTLYLVNTGFPNTERLLEEYKKWFQANYPRPRLSTREPA